MLGNPLSQIERTKDAYMGRPQELQKRANVTKELVDLLAMQQLKKDIDAAKRDQMMQAQGNPATIKDQMQQGLMSEYRQQAAKEMGVGPSEADTVARAQQGMPQGMPQQQARMPQQQARMPQGVMGQARPVQLAKGGIVGLYSGGPISSITDEDIEEYISENPLQANLPPQVIKNKMYLDSLGGQTGIGRLLSALKAGPSSSGGQMRRKRRQAPSGGIATAPAPAAPVVGDDYELTDEEEATLDELQEIIDSEEVVEEKTTPAAPSSTATPSPTGLDAITEKQIELLGEGLPDFAPPEPSQKLKDAISEGIMSLDEVRAEGTKREERALELMGMGPDGQSRKDFEEQLAGLAALRDKNEATQRSRDLVEFLGAGFSKGAETYVAQEDARRKRDDKYLTDRKTIQNARMELQKVAGQEAVDSYDNALTSYLNTRNNAVRDLANLEAQDREDYRTSYKAGVDNQQLQSDILNSLSTQAQNALSRGIAGQTSEAQTLNAFTQVMEEMNSQQTARISSRVAELVPSVIAKLQLPVEQLSVEEQTAYNEALAEAKKEFADHQAAIDALGKQLLERANNMALGSAIPAGSAAASAISRYK